MAIEEKRAARTSPPRLGRRSSRTVQGRAFSAPRTQSLQRIRDRDEVIQELGQALEQSPRKHNIRRANSSFDYRKPSCSREGKVFVDGEAVDSQDHLRRIRTNDTVIFRSPRRPKVSSATFRRGTESALGFREAEIFNNPELGDSSAFVNASLQDGSEPTSGRPYQFRKSNSFEKWKDVANIGVGWLRGG